MEHPNRAEGRDYRNYGSASSASSCSAHGDGTRVAATSQHASTTESSVSGHNVRPQLGAECSFEGARGGRIPSEISTTVGSNVSASPTQAPTKRSPTTAAFGKPTPPKVDTGISGSGDSVVEPLRGVSKAAQKLTIEDYSTSTLSDAASNNPNAKRSGKTEPSTSASGDAAETESSPNIKTFWVAAQNALLHVKDQMSEISGVFRRFGIQEAEYAVQAGFDEKLITSGRGYLEQIYIFVSAKLDATTLSDLLPALGRICSPFSSILVTEFSRKLIPVFKDGRNYEYNQLVLDTTSKFSNDKSTVNMLEPPTKLCVSHTLSSNIIPSRLSQRGPRSQRHNKGSPDERSPSPRESPRPESGARGDGNHIINFEVASDLCKIEGDTNDILQNIGVNGAVSIEAMSSGKGSQSGTTQYPARRLKFLRLGFNTKQTTPDIGYRQLYIGIFVDSCVEAGQIARMGALHPTLTKAFLPEEKTPPSTLRGKAKSRGGATSSYNSESNETSGKKAHKFSITEHDHGGLVEWGFSLDNINNQDGELHMDAEILPVAEFTFVSENKGSPRCMEIVISSYWTNQHMLVPDSRGSHPTLRQFIKSFRSDGDPKQKISYSNLLQVVTIKTVPHTHPTEYQYDAHLQFQTGDEVELPTEPSSLVSESVVGTGPPQRRDSTAKVSLATKSLKSIKAKLTRTKTTEAQDSN